MKSIQDKLSRIGALVDGWTRIGAAGAANGIVMSKTAGADAGGATEAASNATGAGTIDELERDLALRLLQEVYSEIKFGGKACAGASEPAPFAAKPERPESVAPASPTSDTQDEPSGNAAQAGRTSSASGKTLDHNSLLEHSSDHTTALGDAAQNVTATGQTSEQVPALTPAQEMTGYRKVAPELIRSLYGPDPVPTSTQTPPDPATASHHRAPATSDSMQDTAHDSTTPDPTADTSNRDQDTAPRPAEPDNAPAGQPLKSTLGDTLSSHPSLRKSIGLNDRFLMIRDLFHGEGAAFDMTINKLEEFSNLDDAIIHIHDNYSWNSDSEGAKRLVAILERIYCNQNA